jgi:hypothetical protein
VALSFYRFKMRVFGPKSRIISKDKKSHYQIIDKKNVAVIDNIDSSLKLNKSADN